MVCIPPVVHILPYLTIGSQTINRVESIVYLRIFFFLCDFTRMGNSSSDRTSGGQPGGKEARSNILIDSSEDADLFQREDSKVSAPLFKLVYGKCCYADVKMCHFIRLVSMKYIF